MKFKLEGWDSFWADSVIFSEVKAYNPFIKCANIAIIYVFLTKVRRISGVSNENSLKTIYKL